MLPLLSGSNARQHVCAAQSSPTDTSYPLAAQLRHGRPLAPGPADELHYVPVPRAAVNDLEQLRVLSEEPWLEPLDGDLEGVNGRASSSERTGSASPRTPEGLPSANGHSKRRRLSHDANLPEYVPRTLPGFPELPPQEGAGSSAPDAAAAVASGEVGWIAVDGEWAQLQAAKRHAAAVERAQARSALENGDALHANGGDSPAPPEPAASPAAGDEADSAPPTLDMWRRGVRYEGSMLASQQETWDLPSLPATRAPAEVTHNSSLRAFANDYRALLSEHTAREMLTPSGSAHAAAAAMRRTLALSTADPGKFLPTDSVFAATYARPTVIPFQPSASHFVTSTGKFAPTRPLGRPVTLIAPSGSLVPTLSYRWPTHTLNAARSIAGPGLQQRVARFSDPEPVYDASGVERVFQGAPAPTELLEPNHSALAPALRHLSVATQPRQDALDAQPLLSTFNLAEKPKEGMLVHTWEWTTRDYAEPTLPGKRVRGVNEAEGSGRAGAGAMSGPDTPRAERGV